MRRNLWLAVALGLCAVSLWAGLRGLDRQSGQGVAPTAAAPAPAHPVHVRVVNGTGRAGLARDMGSLLGRCGLVVTGVGNAPGTGHGATVLVNRRLDEGAAAALARRLGGVPVLREWDERCTEDAVVVLGADWESVREALAAGS